MAQPQVGTETGRTELVVTDEQVDQYLESMEMDPALFPAAAGRPRRVPPDLVPKMAMDALIQDYCWHVIGPNIRAKQAFKFLAPVHVGQRIRGVGRLVDMYERRGKTFVTFEAVFSDESGKPLVVDTRTQLVTGDGFKLEK